MMSKGEKFLARAKCTGEACTVYLSGVFDLSVASQFQSVVDPLIGRNEQELVMNLRELEYIDSTGIGFMISIYKARHALGSGFRMVDVPERIGKLFELTGITQFVQTTGLSTLERKEA